MKRIRFDSQCECTEFRHCDLCLRLDIDPWLLIVPTSDEGIIRALDKFLEINLEMKDMGF